MSTRSRWTGLVLGLLLAVCLGASAQSMKVGVLDEDRLRENYPQLRETLDKLKADVDSKQKEFDDVQDKLKSKQDKVNIKKSLTPEDPGTKQEEKELVLGLQGLRDSMNTTNRDLYKQRVEALKPFVDQIRQAVENVAKANNLDVVLKRDSVAYFGKAADVTDLVVAELKNMGPVKTTSSGEASKPASGGAASTPAKNGPK